MPALTAVEGDTSRATRLHPFRPSVLLIAGAVIAVQLAFAGRYGWHRDELYFLACSRHLAWGYVDQPPFTPAVARLATALFGTSLLGLRVVPALADAAMVVLAAVIARELGGGRRAQMLAAVAVALSTVLLATGHLLSTATFDFLAWTALTAVVVRILRTGDGRWWLAAGVIAGVGLENKHSVAFVIGGIALGILATRRDLLRQPLLWVGVGIALLIWLPNLVWQSQHGWPLVDMSRSLHAEGVNDGNSFLFLPMQLVFLSPAVTPLWIAGLVWLGRSERGRPYRPIAVAWVVLAVAFVVTAGKPYYLAGLYPALLAAGSVWLDRRWQPRAFHRYLAVVVAVGVVSLPLGLPILPISVAGSGPIAALNKEFRESYGWPQFARTVDAVPGAIVFTSNYGEAGALDRFAPRRAAYSGHNNYWWWGPPPDSALPVVVVGHYSPAFLDSHFRGCQLQTRITNPAGVPNDEKGAGVWSCTSPAQPWHLEWRSLRHYTA
jgi:hypothetical protein